MDTLNVVSVFALMASTFISFGSLLITYLNNKANIQARRSEIAYMKQVDAFRIIAEKMGRIRQILADKLPLATDEKEIASFFNEMNKGHKEFDLIYKELRIYLPPVILTALEEYGRQISEYIQKRLIDQSKPFIEYINKLERRIVSLMQEHMGI